ncbi:MAG: glycosyltransferase, partial [Nitrosospira sp.]
MHFAEYAANLALALAEKWEVLLVLYRDHAEAQLGSGWADTLGHSDLTLLVLERPNSVVSILGNAKQLTHTVQLFEPDVIHYQEDPRDELILGLFFLRSTPTVLTVHDPINHLGVDSDRLKYSRFRLYRPLVRRAAHMAITHGRLLADVLIKECPYLK